MLHLGSFLLKNILDNAIYSFSFAFLILFPESAVWV